MNTKKVYEIPEIQVVELDGAPNILAQSPPFGEGLPLGSWRPWDDDEEDEEDDE